MNIHETVRWFLRALPMRPQNFVLMCTDAIALQLSVILVFILRSMGGNVSLDLYISVSVMLLVGPFFCVFLGANQSISLPAHKEIKQLFLAVSLAYLVILTTLFMTQIGLSFSRLIILGAWLVSVFMVPFLRGRVRRALCHQDWWQTPVVFLQTGPRIDTIWESLESHPRRGLKPVAAIDVDREADLAPQTADLLAQYPRAMAVFLLDEDSTTQGTFIRKAMRLFRGVLLVPPITMGAHRLWLTPRDLEGGVGLLVRQNLMDVRRLWVKRIMDVVLTLLGSIVVLPVGLLLALLIKLDSRGPALYAQKRIGQNGRIFKVYKFRTMVPNAGALLETYLAQNPHLAAEWQREQKLHNDPRITRVGKWLRKLSLDELPQLWNVFVGDMSLVGPRPIVQTEIDRYGAVYKEYMRVKPGITGLWQVSGRNNTSYQERINLDHYYVTNWSIWMDIWILVRTIPVVLVGHGAY